MRWFWAAYRMGTWNEIFPEGLQQDAFSEKVLELVASVDVDWLIEDSKLRPIGVVLGNFRFGGHGVEPHVEWFDWATPRAKLEAVAHFLRQVGKTYKIFLYITEKDLKFWERVWSYRLLKKGCKISDCYGVGDHATMYYTAGPF